MVAGRWTLFDQSAIDDLLPTASLHHVSVIAARVFNSGVLADPDADDRFVNYFYRPAPPEIRDRVRRIRAIVRRPSRSARAALQFPLTHPAVATVCIGCRSAEEVGSNLEALEVDIPPALWHDLADQGLLRPEAVPSARLSDVPCGRKPKCRASQLSGCPTAELGDRGDSASGAPETVSDGPSKASNRYAVARLRWGLHASAIWMTSAWEGRWPSP